MKTLNHDDKVKISGRYGYVGTVRGMATEYTGVSAKYNTNPDEDVKNALAKGHEIYWVNQRNAVLYGDKNAYEIERKAWENAIELVDGEQVIIEGDIVTVKYNGNYSDMCKFLKQ